MGFLLHAHPDAPAGGDGGDLRWPEAAPERKIPFRGRFFLTRGGGAERPGRNPEKPLLALPGVCYWFPPMPDQSPAPNDFIHSEEFLHGLMRRQLRLSIGCASAFLLVLVGLPLANYFAPEFMSQPVGGFTLTWLLLGVLVFPFVWIIARVFITRSMALEEAEVALAAVGNEQRQG